MTAMAIRPGPPADRHVRVWFGEHCIVSYKADAASADRYAASMARRFVGLRVTCQPLDGLAEAPRPLPSERLWDVTPN